MRLEEALLEIDQLYEADDKFAVIITSTSGGAVVYCVVCFNHEGTPMIIKVTTTGKITKMELFGQLISAPWERLQAVSGYKLLDDDRWFTATSDEIVEINNKLFTRS